MPIPSFYYNKTSLAFTGGTNCVIAGCNVQCRNIDYNFDYGTMLTQITPSGGKRGDNPIEEYLAHNIETETETEIESELNDEESFNLNYAVVLYSNDD